MTKLPRAKCVRCGRKIAAKPETGRLSKGRLWRHDTPQVRRGSDGALVSCSGSLEIVDLADPVVQLAFDVDAAAEGAGAAPTLFVI